MDATKAKERFYKPDQYDNDAAFLEIIKSALKPDMRVLDAGAGAGDIFSYDFKSRVKEMVGVDLDPRVEQNPRLDRGIKSDLTSMPFDDDYFDVIFSRYVLEHIQSPQLFLAEINRILKPGGLFIFMTPNKWHYVSIASRLTPQAFHNWYNRLRGRQDEDTFPTLYKLNSISNIRSEFKQAGFTEKQMILCECCPNYMVFSWPTFLLGVLYERIVNSCSLFKSIRVNILAQYIKNNN